MAKYRPVSPGAVLLTQAVVAPRRVLVTTTGPLAPAAAVVLR